MLAGLAHSQSAGSSDLAVTGSKVGLWLEIISRLGTSCLESRWPQQQLMGKSCTVLSFSYLWMLKKVII